MRSPTEMEGTVPICSWDKPSLRDMSLSVFPLLGKHTDGYTDCVGDDERLQRVKGLLFPQEPRTEKSEALFLVTGKQFCSEALSPRIPASTTGRTRRSCRKCVLRINGRAKC